MCAVLIFFDIMMGDLDKRLVLPLVTRLVSYLVVASRD